MDFTQIFSLIRSWALPIAVLVGLYIGAQYLRTIEYVEIIYGYRDVSAIAAADSVLLDPTVAPRSLSHGDLVGFRRDDSKPSEVLAYVAGLPGDRVAIADRAILVNGTPLPERDSGRSLPQTPPVVVPDGHLFLVSDGHQYDSLVYGPVPIHLYLGKAEGY